MISLTYILNNKTDMFGLSTKMLTGSEAVLMAIKIISFTSSVMSLFHKQKEDKENEIKPKESIPSNNLVLFRSGLFEMIFLNIFY